MVGKNLKSMPIIILIFWKRQLVFLKDARHQSDRRIYVGLYIAHGVKEIHNDLNKAYYANIVKSFVRQRAPRLRVAM